VDNIDEENRKLMPQEILQEYKKAVKQSKESAIVEFDLGEDISGHLSFDISLNSKKSFTRDSLKVIGAMGNIASAFLAFQQLALLQEEFQKEIILAVISMMEIHDPYTKGHSEQVANISRDIAKKMGFEEEEIKKTFWAGMVHDIGKILVPAEILNKPARLTDEEYAIIKKHPVWGFEVLENSKKLREIAKYVRSHHERYDGKGYPDGIIGKDIPKIARIMAVADTWDAMTRDRAYRKGLLFVQAVKELERNSGTQFDPEVVEVFLEMNIS